MNMLKTVQRVHAEFNRAATRFCVGVSLAALAGMTVVVLLQVVCRYVFSAALPWPEEAARFMMVWMTFLVAPFAYREALVVRLDAAVRRFPGWLKPAHEGFLHFIVFAVSILLCREAVWMTAQGATITSSALGLPMQWVFLVLPISLALVASVAVERTGRLFRGPQTADPEDAAQAIR